MATQEPEPDRPKVRASRAKRDPMWAVFECLADQNIPEALVFAVLALRHEVRGVRRQLRATRKLTARLEAARESRRVWDSVRKDLDTPDDWGR